MSRQSKIPGTFKTVGVMGHPVVPTRDMSHEGAFAEALMLNAGALIAQRWLLDECTIMCAREPYASGFRWHVSISHPERYPTWDEMKIAIYGISTIELPKGRVFAQLLGPVADGEWVNVADNCFHWYEIEDPLQ